jgi:hypothetical protein
MKQGTNASQKLLEWAKNCTMEYDNVKVTNFTTSWKDGIAWLALLHFYDSSLVPDIHDLKQDTNELQNLERAFKLAEEHYGIERYLE